MKPPTFSKLGVVLVSIVIGSVGSSLYFVYHAPGALELSLEREYDVEPDKMGWILSIYSISGSFTPIFTCVIITMMGVRLTSLLYVSVILIGAALFAVSPFLGDSMFATMLVGRGLIGLGVGVLVVSRILCNKWFAGTSESLSIGVVMVMEQAFGSAMPFVILEPLAQTNVDVANWFSVPVSCLSIAMLGFYVLLERRCSEHLQAVENFKQGEKRAEGNEGTPKADEPNPADERPRRTSSQFSALHRGLSRSLSTLDMDSKKSQEEGFWKSVGKFGVLVWLQNFTHLFIVSILYIFANTFPYFLQQRHGMSPAEAGTCTSLVYWCVVLAPIHGVITDQIGQRLRLQTLCSFVGCICFAMLFKGIGDPWVLVVVLGVCFSFLEQNSYSLAARATQGLPQDAINTSFAIMTVFLEGGLIFLPIGVGYLGQDGDFSNQNLVFAASLGVGFIVSVIMIFMDKPDDPQDERFLFGAQLDATKMRTQQDAKEQPLLEDY